MIDFVRVSALGSAMPTFRVVKIFSRASRLQHIHREHIHLFSCDDFLVELRRELGTHLPVRFDLHAAGTSHR